MKSPLSGQRLMLVLAVVFTFGMQVSVADEPAAAPSLYDRLGGWDGIDAIVRDTVALHQANDKIAHYFTDVDVEQLVNHVTAFFAAGTGGPSKYEGRDMTTTHASMGLTDEDFDSAVADIMKSLEKNGKDESVRADVTTVLYSLKPAVMGAAGN
jgi:hemoglobin